MILAPGTSLQSRIAPVKMPYTVFFVMLVTAFALLVIMHTPSRAIFVNTSPFGSAERVARGVADVEVSFGGAAMPTSDSPP